MSIQDAATIVAGAVGLTLLIGLIAAGFTRREGE